MVEFENWVVEFVEVLGFIDIGGVEFVEVFCMDENGEV